jgi:hypothetical protein
MQAMNDEVAWIERTWARMERENPTQTILGPPAPKAVEQEPGHQHALFSSPQGQRLAGPVQ